MVYLEKDKTIRDIFDNLSEHQREVAYEIIGQALIYGYYDTSALKMFNKEEQMVLKFLLLSAKTFYI